MAALRRHPSLDGKLVTKGIHNPIPPNSPTLPKMSFVALIHPNCCWMIQYYTEKTLQLTPPNWATPVNHYKPTLPVSFFRENQSRIGGRFVGPPKFQLWSLQILREVCPIRHHIIHWLPRIRGTEQKRDRSYSTTPSLLNKSDFFWTTLITRYIFNWVLSDWTNVSCKNIQKQTQCESMSIA